LSLDTVRITRIAGREVLDCRGLPTIQVDVWVEDGILGRADVPAGRSTGSNEAVELRDGGSRFGGFGVTAAVAKVETVIAPALVGAALGSQRELDHRLIELDGTPNKSNLGANAIAGVSLAAARALANCQRVPLYRSLSANAHVLPVPQVNLLNGGLHASNDLDFQEFIVMPVGAESFLEAMQMCTEINLALAEILRASFGKVALNTGDEGGFAPPLREPEEALDYLQQAVDRAGYSTRCMYGLDCAATHFYDRERDVYEVAGRTYDREELLTFYEKLISDFGVVSLEDPFHEDDFQGFAEIVERTAVQIVGDDLLVTNAARVEQAVERKAANSLLWKFNQVGTLTEAMDAFNVAARAGYSVVVSERSGETEDPLIADLVVGLDAGQIKTGAPVRGERTAKYNRLLFIEQELGTSARYAGSTLKHLLGSPRG
jgi:enolase